MFHPSNLQNPWTTADKVSLFSFLFNRQNIKSYGASLKILNPILTGGFCNLQITTLQNNLEQKYCALCILKNFRHEVIVKQAQIMKALLPPICLINAESLFMQRSLLVGKQAPDLPIEISCTFTLLDHSGPVIF